jgi:YVTN family beta-propeller protein
MQNHRHKPQFLVVLTLTLAIVALITLAGTTAFAALPTVPDVAQSAQRTAGTAAVADAAALTNMAGVTASDEHSPHHPEGAGVDNAAVDASATVSAPVMMGMMGEMMSTMSRMQSMMAPGMMGAGMSGTVPMTNTITMPMIGMGPGGQSVSECTMIGPTMSMMGSMMSMMGAMQTMESMMAGHGVMTGTMSMPGMMMDEPGMMGAGMMNSAEWEFMLDHMNQMMGQIKSMAAACRQDEQASQPFDLGFIDSMIVHHQGAVVMAEEALAQAERAELRDLAEAIIAAQTTEIEQMQAWRDEWFPNLAATAGMGMDMGMMIVPEDAAKPYDQRWIEAMISHHQGAIEMADMALKMSERAEMRTLAEAIIAAQTAEIEIMQSWLAEWYGEPTEVTRAATSLAGTIWVANEEGNSLSAIDAATNRVVATLAGIPGPHNLQVSPDGNTVWAVSGHEALAVAVDSQSYALLGIAPVGKSPAHVVVSPDGMTAYVSNSGDSTVTALDTAAFTVKATIPVGEFPHGLRPSPDGQQVAVANLRSNTVSLIDTATLTVDATVEVGVAPAQVAFAPDGTTLYVTLNGEDAIAVVDLETKSVASKVAVGGGPVQIYVTPDASAILVANQGTEEAPGTTLSIIDAVTLSEVATVETGQGAHGVVVEPSSRYAYVTNLYGDNLAVVDLAVRQVVVTVPTGASPNGVSFSSVVAIASPSSEITLPIPVHEDDTGEHTDDAEGSEVEEHDQHH